MVADFHLNVTRIGCPEAFSIRNNTLIAADELFIRT